MINKTELWNLLETVHSKKYIGVASVDLIQFAVDKQLLERTSVGNFILTSKGASFLENQLTWEKL